ncbi:tetratricopeptide repeat protein [Chloroflexota bacterium]
MLENLLATKLHIPRSRRDLVPRPRLIDRLDDGLSGKLTIVSAPAGYGKTTALTSWIDHSQLQTAWLSIDEMDNELDRFLTYLIAALQQLDEGIGLDVQSALSESQAAPIETLLTRLVNETEVVLGEEEHRNQFILVLDDYHLIKNQSVHDALNFLLDNLPPSMHLVIAGRSDPPVPISKLRVQGEVAEIRTPDLRFTKNEAAEFLNDLIGFDLSAEEITALEKRTEGWIASLQLAALSMQGREDRKAFVDAFSGSHCHVIDYLVDEVMSRQPEDLQAFLYQTSILDRFSAPLCDAALEITTSRQILGKLEGANLFLIPLDDERYWYRYHHLFADFLGQRLREAELERIPELHRRASLWYEAQGLVDEAIQHALAAGDLKNATHLVDQIAVDLVVRRESNKLLKLINQLPPDLCQEYPMLCIWHAWALLFLGQLEAVEPVLQSVETNQDKMPGTPRPGYATTVRAYLANQRGDFYKAIALSEKALEQMSGVSPDRITLIFQGAAIIWLGVNHRELGDLDQARRLFIEAASLNKKAGNIYAALASLEQLADLATIQGQLHQAVEIFGRGLDLARKWSDEQGEGRGALVAASGLHLGLGTVLYEWNDLVGAEPHILRALELHELGEVWGRFHSYRMLGYLKQAEGDYMTSYDLLGKGLAIREKISIRQSNISSEPGLEQLSILLSRAGPDMAHLLTESAQRVETRGLKPDDEVDFSSPADYALESEYSALVRALIALGRASEALPLLERLLESARSMGRQGDEIRYLILRALAFQAIEDKASALESLSHALALAKTEGYVRIFVDEGQPMATLLVQAVSQEMAPDYVGELLDAFPEEVRQAVGFDMEMSSIPQPLVEPLSERELEVLRLMATGLKYQEIAGKLVISLNTVRHHTRNIYGKLDVNSRAQAIARARDLGLL